MTNRKINLITYLALDLLALAQIAHAVVPAPDGGYPGGNTAEGQNALFGLTSGGYNTAVGYLSLRSDTTGSFNTAVGAGTLLANTGDENTATGIGALLSNTTGGLNTASGAFALFNNTEGSGNTATGESALFSNSTGIGNAATGYSALYSNITGTANTAVGNFALAGNVDGDSNTAIGGRALSNNTTGGANTAIGNNALHDNSTGIYNVAVGEQAGAHLTTGSGNVCIGQMVVGVADESNITRIRNIGSTPLMSGATVVIDGTGGIGDQRLGYASSSRRYKQDIKSMDKASETLFALKPVTFRAKGNMDSAHAKHYGLIAEDVAAVDSDLVVYNPEGKPETLRFDSINAMLLNEFLKEHRRVEQQSDLLENQACRIREQETTIGELKKEMETVVTRLKEQETKIQRVSDQIEIDKFAAGRMEPQGCERHRWVEPKGRNEWEANESICRSGRTLHQWRVSYGEYERRFP